tara:strand:- start:1969 stop:2589 length:621 start_codon:yes stop_codon:yes gene_type:complete
MTAHDLDIANGTGSAVRADINNYIDASASNFADANEPTGANTQPYQWFVKTGNNTLYMRDASSNDTWHVVGTVGVANLGLAPKASPTFTGTADFNSNTAIKCPDGTTGERPGSAAVGMLRYNTTTNGFEGYSGSSPSWGEIGGAGAGATGGNSGANAVFWENQVTVSHDYTLTASRGAGTFGGPDGVTINDGVTVTIPDTSTWTII